MKTWQKILIALGLTLMIGLIPSPVKAGVDDFSFKKLDVEYRLSKDTDGRAVLAVKEKFIAVFPEFNQNRGIIRSIPLNYQGHSLSLKMGGIYRNGLPAPIYKDEEKDDFRVLTIRDASDSAYLHGENEYEFNYTMRDVIMKPQDADLQEFYWDTNGTGWRQPFNVVQAKVVIDESIADEIIKDRLFCYTGGYGSAASDCIAFYNEANSTFYFQTIKRLAPGSNMTIAMAFKPDTFVLYKAAAWEGALLTLVMIASLVTLPLAWLAFKRLSAAKNAQKITTVPPEYLPPQDLDIYSSNLFHANFSLESISGKTLAAGLVDLAVNHRIKITETKQKGLFGLGGRDYVMEPLAGRSWTENQERFFKKVFDKNMVVGQNYRLKKNDYSLGTRMRSFNKYLIKQLDAQGLIDDKATKEIRKIVYWRAGAGLLIALVTAGVMVNYGSRNYYQYLPEVYGFLQGLSMPILVLAVAGGVLNLVTLLTAANFTKITPQGQVALTKLRGLKLYIKMAEKERLAFAQSVETAERDLKERIVLYERLLPYAMIFGLEKSWNEVLGKYYQEANYQPDWYFGAAVFNAAHFSSSMKAFSSVASSAYASSSSGSGGGGFSGGGGGGGGGGGC